MANFAYTYAKRLFAKGDLDWDEAGHDMRIMLLMTNTTADTEKDKQTIATFTTLDECNGANYVRKALANQIVNQDDPNLRAEMDADDIVWTALGVGTRQNQGMVLYRFVTNDADSIPIAWIDTGGFPFDGNGFLRSPSMRRLIERTLNIGERCDANAEAQPEREGRNDYQGAPLIRGEGIVWTASKDKMQRAAEMTALSA